MLGYGWLCMGMVSLDRGLGAGAGNLWTGHGGSRHYDGVFFWLEGSMIIVQDRIMSEGNGYF